MLIIPHGVTPEAAWSSWTPQPGSALRKVHTVPDGKASDAWCENEAKERESVPVHTERAKCNIEARGLQPEASPRAPTGIAGTH